MTDLATPSPDSDPAPALIVGAGPAGLMAAETLCARGHRVEIVEAKPSAGRKLLMAGRSGLNLTNAAPADRLRETYAEAAPWLAPMLDAFGPAEIRAWAEGLGQETFEGSSGRVFPRAMKASPLLRAWLARLGAAGTVLRTGWRWEGWAEDGAEAGALRFATPEGPATRAPSVTVLALGGASWARLGSDGAWAPWLAARGVALAPFQPANMGFRVAWSDRMAPLFGAPVKNVRLIAGGVRARGEFAISARGIEGGGIYAVARALREGAPLALDLFPDLEPPEIARRLANARRGESLVNRLRKTLKMDPARRGLALEFGRGPGGEPPPADPLALARLLKALPVPHDGPRPLDEAISVAGGVRRAALDEGLMLRAVPGVFCAGEMLDWEAPTGGQLLTACLATGRHAGAAAAARLEA
ncbi:hypothetical protein SAMN05444336_101611 [Albimonas donghaensis]|uniref:TIGR03862 family flavoprotein n=1 Tax=Albimonas donghaensis TaxID=356660 RepID=A0A1H2SBT0_9RHOB|nr:TIGR03862 family flavoprotein [Albimonas donghaensis]SDW28967.1 hypothetical protein SAMN05444336_101611 [Albimonas donghaensis]